jgi:putative flippase GtrA
MTLANPSGAVPMPMSEPKPERPRRWSRQFAAFLAVGLIATAIQYAVLLLAVRALHADPVLGSSVGFVLSAAVNYLLNYHLTFRSSSSHASAVGRFLLVSGAGLLLNGMIMYLLTQPLHLVYWLAQLAATAVVTIWNFLGSALWTFAVQRPRPSDDRTVS